jgi:hypothetical protein
LVFAALNGHLDKIPLEKLKFAKRILNSIGPSEINIEEDKKAPSSSLQQLVREKLKHYIQD